MWGFKVNQIVKTYGSICSRVESHMKATGVGINPQVVILPFHHNMSYSENCTKERFWLFKDVSRRVRVVWHWLSAVHLQPSTLKFNIQIQVQITYFTPLYRKTQKNARDNDAQHLLKQDPIVIVESHISQ